MTPAFRAFAALALLTLAACAIAQAPAPIVRFAFDDTDGGWNGQGTNCRASITTQSSFNGAGALKFEYDLKPKAMSGLAWMPSEGALAGATMFRFWVRVEQPTTLALMVQERGGGRYTSMFAAPKGKWQKVEVSTSDLILNEGSNDPRDADGKLNVERIEAVSFGDLAQFIAQAGSPEFAALLGLELGPRTMMLDDFTVTAEKPTPGYTVSAKEVVLDTFARPQAAWLATCAAEIGKAATTGAARALVATYRQMAGRIVALGRAVPKGVMKGMGRLSFTVSSQRHAMLLVQVEEAGGGKFNTIVEVDEGSADKQITVECANLNAADDSPVKDRGVKMELATQVVFIDAAMFGGAASEQDNVLTISELKLRPAQSALAVGLPV